MSSEIGENSTNCENLSADIVSAIEKIANERDIREYKLQTQPICGVGENSYGLVLQVKLLSPAVSMPANVFSCVVKIAPKNPARRQHMKVAEYYAREVFIYQKIIATFEMLFTKPEHQFDMVPKIYAYSLKKCNEFIIFEDLSLAGYRQNLRVNCPSFDMVSATLKSLAKFHAMSFVVQEKKPEIFDQWINEISDNLFTDSIDPVTIEFSKKYIRQTQSALVQANDDVASSHEAMNILRIIEDNLKSICLQAVNGPKCAPYSVICHGDFWNNNIMYQGQDKEGKHPIRAKLIDFQMSRYSSPILDIVHYLFLCTEKDLRDKHFNQLLEVYYAALGSHLRQFDLDLKNIFPRQTFEHHIKEYGIFGFCMASLAMPFFISNSCELPDLDEVSQAISDLSSKDTNGKRTSESCNGNNTELNGTNSEKARNLVNEYEMLTERTIPIFNRKMVGIVADLMKYGMTNILYNYHNVCEYDRKN